ncbi:MAG: winged helix-turn-helix transcriptional regulator [Leptospiraceae bacterium]|nr:winged helix-turn-helix transcriptional regulator [Leptospiraceae bacterium]
MTEALSSKESLLINAIGQESQNQRSLAQNSGLSLGMTNILLKKLISKGYVKVVQLNGRTLRYILTARGFQEKLQRTHSYLQISIRRIRQFRHALTEQLANSDVIPNPVYVYGSGEVFELTCEILSEAGYQYEIGLPMDLQEIGQLDSESASVGHRRQLMLDCNVRSPELERLHEMPWLEIRHVAILMES